VFVIKLLNDKQLIIFPNDTVDAVHSVNFNLLYLLKLAQNHLQSVELSLSEPKVELTHLEVLINLAFLIIRVGLTIAIVTFCQFRNGRLLFTNYLPAKINILTYCAKYVIKVKKLFKSGGNYFF
jgi:hypothetical protein